MLVKVVLSVIVAQLTGGLGAIFTIPAIDQWYANLNKPMFTPPNWLFAPAWTILYLLMGIAAGLVWAKGSSQDKVQQALIIYGSQLVLNFAWSLVFFGAKSIGGGLLIIGVLWFAIIVCMVYFYRVNKVSALLLLPYWLWVSFAAALNYQVFVLN